MRKLAAITVVLATVVGGATPVANADPDPATPAPAPDARPEARRTKRTRVYHTIAIGGLTLAYGLSEFAFKDTFAPKDCGWCNPPGIDKDVRDALVWDNVIRAQLLSNITGYVVVPIATNGKLIGSGYKHGSRRMFDDAAAVLESAATIAVIDQITKFSFGRQRPFVRFGDLARPHSPDDNLSFFSGHTSFTFALAVSAGVVAHRRHYKLEPVVWATGLTFAAATGYFRIAGDKHYFSDVIVGAAAGTLTGYLVPTLLHDDVLGADVNLVPTGNGVAVVGTF
jgi:hypothetical protein